MDRRQFLSLAPVAALAASHSRIKVGAHAWVYAADKPEYDFTSVLDQVFDDLKYAGLDGVELMNTVLRHNDSVDRIGTLSAKYDLPVIGTSYEANMWDRKEHPRILDEAHPMLERVAKLGGRRLGTSVGDARRKKTPDELDAQAEMVRQLDAICKKHGLALNLHNHIYEVRDDEYDLRGTLARIPDAKLGPDFDWLTGAKVDPVNFIQRYGQRIVYGHLRDRKADGTWSEAMGEGAIDYGAIGQALRKANFHGMLAIELAHPRGFKLTRPLRESWKISREYVRRVMGY
jgi:sugar phosphate isomerase/epimerase